MTIDPTAFKDKRRAHTYTSRCLALLAVVAGALGGVSTASAAEGWSAQAVDGGVEGGTSVSCASSTFCIATGGGTASYNGTSWSVLSTTPSVWHASCVSSSFCAAVAGSATGKYISLYTGSSWGTLIKVDTSPHELGLETVSCAATTFCVAIDAYANVYTYNGTSWSLPTNLTGAETAAAEYSVSCTSDAFCVAVGDKDEYTYNGASWTAGTRHLTGGTFTSVSCVSEVFCIWVSGDEASQFNGTSWSAPTNIDSDPGPGIRSVSCGSTSNCVGVDEAGGGVTFNGTSWSAPSELDPYGNADSENAERLTLG